MRYLFAPWKSQICYIQSIFLIVACLVLLDHNAFAQSSRIPQDMAKDAHTGLIVKVVAGSNKIKAYKTPDGADESFDLELLTPYYVMEDAGEFYKITNVAAASQAEAEKGLVGYVRKAQVQKWPTREALHYTPFVTTSERNAILAWDDRDKVTEFMRTGDRISFPPAFEEDLKSSLNRSRDLRPYPVLDSFKVPFKSGSGEKRIYNVLLPAAIPPLSAVEIKKEDVGQVKKTLQSVTFAVVFDATGSMKSLAEKVAREIADVVDSLSADTFSDARMGFVFYRDKDDAEKALIVPPTPVREASNKLLDYAPRMSGGGDASEPVLDAIALTIDFFDWAAGDEQSGARRIAIIVLNDDAKPTTEGLIDPRVEAGLRPQDIGRKLFEGNIIPITVQAGPNAGANLMEVLQTVATTAKGSFVTWKDAGVGSDIGVAIKEHVKEGVITAKTETKDIMAEVTIKGEKAVIPLKVLDGEKLERLRRAGIKYNIEDNKGGVLVEPGYLPENEDLLDPQIKVEKDTVQRLIELFSVLSVTSANASDFRKTVEESIAAMAGEKPDPKENISAIVKKKLGIQFRTPMLDVSVEALDGLVPAEKLQFQKRIKEAADRLGDFSESRLSEFDKLGSVWMPVRFLP